SDKLQQNTIRTKVPLKLGQRSTASPLEKAGLQDVRLYGRALKPEEVKSLGAATRLAWLLSKPAERRSETDKKELYEGWLTHLDREFQDDTVAVAKLEQEEAAIKSRGSITHVMQEREEAPLAYV